MCGAPFDSGLICPGLVRLERMALRLPLDDGVRACALSTWVHPTRSARVVGRKARRLASGVWHRAHYALPSGPLNLGHPRSRQWLRHAGQDRAGRRRHARPRPIEQGMRAASSPEPERARHSRCPGRAAVTVGARPKNGEVDGCQGGDAPSELDEPKEVPQFHYAR